MTFPGTVGSSAFITGAGGTAGTFGCAGAVGCAIMTRDAFFLSGPAGAYAIPRCPASARLQVSLISSRFLSAAMRISERTRICTCCHPGLSAFPAPIRSLLPDLVSPGKYSTRTGSFGRNGQGGSSAPLPAVAGRRCGSPAEGRSYGRAASTGRRNRRPTRGRLPARGGSSRYGNRFPSG